MNVTVMNGRQMGGSESQDKWWSSFLKDGLE